MIEYQLKELCLKITDGSHFSPKENSIGNKIIATVKDMTEYGFKVENCKKISEEDYEKLVANDCKPLKDDILYSKDGTIGNVLVFNDDLDLVLLSSIAILRPNKKLVYPDYLGYYLKNPISKAIVLNNYRSGSVLPRVILKDFKKLPISLPPLPTQKSIAAILASLDDKIELNNRINQNLEELAKAIFKQWFIEFEFPDENGNPYKSSGGEMVDSELGEIPKGWEVNPMKKYFEYVIGGDWGKEEIDDEFSEWAYVVRGTDIPTLASGSKQNIPLRALKPSKLKSRKLLPGDIIIEISGGSKDQPTGRSILITEEILNRLNKVAVPTSFCRLIRPFKGWSNIIGLYLSLIYDEGKTWEYQNQSTGISNFQFKYFEENEKIVLPKDLEIMNRFNDLLISVYSQLTTNENIYLVELRDLLLPKLMSGELTVNEVEEMSEL